MSFPSTKAETDRYEAIAKILSEVYTPSMGQKSSHYIHIKVLEIEWTCQSLSSNVMRLICILDAVQKNFMYGNPWIFAKDDEVLQSYAVAEKIGEYYK